MKKTFSYISLFCHNSFNTKQRQKRYSSYVNRVQEIIRQKHSLPKGIIRRNNSLGKRLAQQQFELNWRNTIMYNKLLNISRRLPQSQKPLKKIKNLKAKLVRQQLISIQNRRLIRSIDKTNTRQNKTFFKLKPLLVKNRFLKNKDHPLPPVILKTLF